MIATKTMVPAALVLLAAGCSSGPLEDPEHVRTWANTASAVGIYARAYGPMAFADGQGPYDDPACPVQSDDGTTATLSGGCVGQDGNEYVGTATVVRFGADRTLTFESFGSFPGPDLRSTMTGTVQMRRVDPSRRAFDVDLIETGETTTTISYSGSVEGDYNQATTWDGSGAVERGGPVAPTGRAQATTVGQRLDDALCSGQATAGLTTIEQDDDVAVIEYDGASDCDADQSARWSLNGEDRGLISGIACSVGGAGAVGSTFPRTIVVALGALGLAIATRRRKRC